MLLFVLFLRVYGLRSLEISDAHVRVRLSSGAASAHRVAGGRRHGAGAFGGRVRWWVRSPARAVPTAPGAVARAHDGPARRSGPALVFGWGAPVR